MANSKFERSRESQERLNAALAGYGGDGKKLLELVKHPDATVRSSGLRGLHRAGHLSQSILAQALSDTAPTVRATAAELAAGYPQIELVALLHDEDARVVEVSAFSLGEHEIAEPVRIDALCQLSREHENALCREAAVAALGAIGDYRGLPAILAATSDKATVRRRAIISLAPFNGPEVDAALARGLTDRDWQVRQAAEDQLEVNP
jgi:HEAT repeat protein